MVVNARSPSNTEGGNGLGVLVVLNVVLALNVLSNRSRAETIAARNGLVVATQFG